MLCGIASAVLHRQSSLQPVLQVVEEHAELEAAAQGDRTLPSHPGRLSDRVRLLFADSFSMDCHTGMVSAHMLHLACQCSCHADGGLRMLHAQSFPWHGQGASGTHNRVPEMDRGERALALIALWLCFLL